uniref:Uncharacterized protein n=1 Tax=Zea mays TaxID=4577 RepID=B6T762_MAIZE|nr:hypothetical protein [Zea mays]
MAPRRRVEPRLCAACNVRSGRVCVQRSASFTSCCLSAFLPFCSGL